LGAVVVVLLVAFFAYSLISSRRIRLEARHARLAEQNSRDELWQALLAQARAIRLSGQAGQRYDSLDAIRRATAIRPSRELRNEAIAALALTDVRLVNTWPFTEGLVSYSSAFDRFAAARQDGQISICLASNGVELTRLPAVAQPPRWLMGFSPDDKVLAMHYSDDVNYVWDVEAGKPTLGPLPGICGAFMPEGGEFVLIRSDAECRFYSLGTGSLTRTVMLPEPLDGVALQPQHGVMGGFRHQSRVAYLFDFPSGQKRFALTHPADVGAIALSGDGELFAVGCYDRRVHIWSTATGVSRAVLEGHDNNVVAIGFNHAGTLLATASWDNTFRLWDIASWKQVLISPGMSYEMKFDGADRFLAHISHGGVAGLLEMASSTEFRQLHVPPDAHQNSHCIALSPDGRLIATGHEDGAALRDATTGAQVAWLPVGPCRAVMFLPDGTGLVTSSEQSLTFWPIGSSGLSEENSNRVGDPRHIREGLRFMGATLSGDGRWVAAANKFAGSVAVYEVAHPENRFALTNLPAVEFVSATADMRWVAAGPWGGNAVNVWNVPERRLEYSFPAHGVARVALSPNGAFLATAGASYKVWQGGSWRQLYEVKKPDTENGLGLMVFSPDSRWLAVLQGGRDIVLLEAVTGTELARLQAPHQPGIGAFCFSTDASKLVALQSDQSIQVWDLRAMRRELSALNLDW
jgi:WD40 repeat protein